jgi:hypothetical protein
VRYGWSLSTDDWERYQNAEPGVHPMTWRRVCLRDLDQDSVPLGPGIYVICVRPSTKYPLILHDLYDAVYVGKALSLRKRFIQHCGVSSSEIERAKVCFRTPLDYWYLETDQIDTLESLLIQCLGPSGNVIAGAIQARIGAPQPAGI